MSPKVKTTLDFVEREGGKALFQARVDSALLRAATAQKDRDGLSWGQLIEAFFRRYLEETKGGR